MNSIQSTSNLADSTPLTLVVFGASGDLTRRKLIPAIFQLWCQGLLPEDFSVVGFARSDKTDEVFIDELSQFNPEALFCRGKEGDCGGWERFVKRISYQRGGYDNLADFQSLRSSIEQGDSAGNCIYYLATHPEAFESIIENLGRSGLARKSQESPWARIVVEKPFGSDLESAKRLNEHARAIFDEDQIFRIDHYLGKEIVQNIMVLRFANGIFENIWSHNFIDHVQITVSESLGVAGRGGYYDKTGAMRDILQNHMMHLLSLVAMEPPIALTAEAVRNEKVKVFRSLRPIPGDCSFKGVLRGQYTEGVVDGQHMPGYLQSPDVIANSATETYVALKANIDNWRWSKTPFYLRTGKCLPIRCTEISIHFKDVPQVLFNRPPLGPLKPNVLVIRVQPNEGISLEFQAKVPGPEMKIQPLKMDFGYAESFGSAPPDAYERLLLDAAAGDATLFTRSDEVEAAWDYVEPVIPCCTHDCENLLYYPAGTWGPAEADEFIQADGRQWYLR